VIHDNDKNNNIMPSLPVPWKPGDHVCRIRSGVDKVQHGIITETRVASHGHVEFTVCEFYAVQKIRIRPHESKMDWERVAYNASMWQASQPRTSAKSHPPTLVLQRVKWLREHFHLMPNPKETYFTSECAAVWCKTGVWSSLQVASVLMGVAKSAALGVFISVQRVTLASGGVAGLLGYTTNISLLAMPYMLPFMTLYGISTVGMPLWELGQARKVWHETTRRLEEAFVNWFVEILDEAEAENGSSNGEVAEEKEDGFAVLSAPLVIAVPIEPDDAKQNSDNHDNPGESGDKQDDEHDKQDDKSSTQEPL